MAGDRLYNQQFIFKDGTITSKYVWESDVVKNNTDKFPKQENEVGVPYFGEEPKEGFTVLTKMSLSEIRKDRLKRSRDHFKREVWETIPKSERKLFRDRKDLKQ